VHLLEHLVDVDLVGLGLGNALLLLPVEGRLCERQQGRCGSNESSESKMAVKIDAHYTNPNALGGAAFLAGAFSAALGACKRCAAT